MSKIKINIIKPDSVKLAGEFDHVIVPGVDGDFGILVGHTPFITKIRPGIISLYLGKSVEKYAIHDGFVTVENDVINIVCDSIEYVDEIDTDRAKEAKDRAMVRLKSSDEDIDYRRAESSLKRALVRIEIKEG